jgi:hypothetical protein
MWRPEKLEIEFGLMTIHQRVKRSDLSTCNAAVI